MYTFYTFILLATADPNMVNKRQNCFAKPKMRSSFSITIGLCATVSVQIVAVSSSAHGVLAIAHGQGTRQYVARKSREAQKNVDKNDKTVYSL